jgi:thymidylate synthase
MAAEAYWILSGDDRVETIAPYNPNISAFSDDGVKFFGAYGPKIHSQIDYVVAKLCADKFSRQAGLTIWRENPPKTLDVPCTVSIFFNIREKEDGRNFLNVNVFMRSSDIWLGVPYDVFNFSMLGYMVCGMLRKAGIDVEPNCLYLTAASGHLYEKNFHGAAAIIKKFGHDLIFAEVAPPPAKLWQSRAELMETLDVLRTTSPGNKLRWWEAVT